MNFYYIWKKDGRKIRGIITFLNKEQFVEDELKMNLEMMKDGWLLVKRGKGGK